MAEGVKQLARTPSFTLTTAGLVLAGLTFAGQEWASKPAIVCLALPGVGGVAIALYRQVQAAAEEWAWQGIIRAFRHPLSDEVRRGLWEHLPQALLALLLLIRLKSREEAKREDGN